jgi:hypothetical protein
MAPALYGAGHGEFKEFLEKEKAWWTSYIPHWKEHGGRLDTMALFVSSIS